MKKRLSILALALIISASASAELRLPFEPPTSDGYTRDLSARISGDWLIVPDADGSVQAERFTLSQDTVNIDAGTFRFRAENTPTLYLCNVTLTTGSAIECQGASYGYHFTGTLDGKNRYIGWVGRRGNRAPALMIKIQ
jgi:hypothetical protein